jgi:hypothetical protein
MVIFFYILFLTSLSWSQSYDLKAPKYNKVVADHFCEFLSRGPLHVEADSSNDTGISSLRARALRVSFLFNDLFFYKIIIEELRYEDLESKDVRIRPDQKIEVINSYILDGLDVEYGAITGILTNVKFIKWNTWNSFTLSEQGNPFLLAFKGEGLIEITPLEGE